MRPQKVNDDELIISLSKIFRTQGYEGTSLSDLSNITGLKKASLYHRFPNGKKEMAESVLIHIGKWVADNIFNVLNKEGDPAEDRLKNALFQIRELYNGGLDSCLFKVLSTQNGMDLFGQSITNGMNEWLKAFKHFGLSINLSEHLAEEKALQTLIDIQGSLLVSKGLQDTTVFENTLKQIKDRYN
ncbi:TetR/AcrR family transcriptional regulator [Pseudotamlana agarivorans]|uniref:TetR/AcrR family transcriptional regulator n=1 Tax=Pseudotamlana agarivorans TaxID=481183 RepID=UPI0008375593|nr:TetR/AcrR family transcriptional regulator [Tamlana agarivorans]